MADKPSSTTWRFIVNIIWKACLLFMAFNVIYALVDPLPTLGRLSVYNTAVPGRERLPFGENPGAYNLSLYHLGAMFESHEVSGPYDEDEYRVFLIGDSSVWGTLLTPQETLAGQLNSLHLITRDGRPIRIYNFGYPTISVTKDLLLISTALEYEPDLIIWLTTLEALPYKKQLDSPILQNNAASVRGLIMTHDLALNPVDPAFVEETFLDKTIIGQRRALADVIRLNLYGIMWASTGIDQYYPDTYTPREEDFEADESFYDLKSPLSENDLAFDVIAAGINLAGDVPVMLINEPMFISMGENSDLRYNFYYPRWAYDEYRVLLQQQADQYGWQYLDLWNAIPSTEYTNSAIHLTPEGSAQLAQIFADAITK